MTSHEWPLVDSSDEDECFYCLQRIGTPHLQQCVIVTKRVELRVHALLSDTQAFTGLWQLDVPHSWDADMIEFHKNEGSWCASNILDQREVVWENDNAWTVLGEAHRAEGCLCNVLVFRFVRVVDPTPKRLLVDVFPSNIAGSIVIKRGRSPNRTEFMEVEQVVALGPTLPEFTRASGDCVCEVCGKEYWRHEMATEIVGSDGPFLNRLCNGRLVKL